jgi:glycine/D-amino acid oxidase-like deaminating enzyme/nitrite reductase/ring-hydroxylating ferredoxin subunit
MPQTLLVLRTGMTARSPAPVEAPRVATDLLPHAKHLNMERDGYRKSLWQTTAALRERAAPAWPASGVDVVIVGAGITGLSTALALQQAGRRCAVLEAHRVGFGTTGGTSAHINTLLELPYDRMIDRFGLDKATLVARGAVDACQRTQQWAALYAPDCQWQARDAFLFAQDDEEADTLDGIVEGTQRVGLEAHVVAEIPFPAVFRKAARFPGQAQFHPTRYLQGLAEAFRQAGGLLVEACRVRATEAQEAGVLVSTERGALLAGHVVYATHVPPGVNVLHFRTAPYRSYVLAARLQAAKLLPAGLVYDMVDPYHYYRTEVVDGTPYLIAGGCDHKTGHEEDTAARFRQLEAHVRSLFPVDEVTHHWSSQYYEPTDGLPYIGKLPLADERILVATGYSGNGITYGTLASMVLTDLITTGTSVHEEVFDPGRVSLVAGFSNFVKEAADVVGQLMAAPFPAAALGDLDTLGKGEGRVVRHDGRSVALHRDEGGALHAVDPACSHIKCTVSWNSAERSWDCPCHGSRFSVDGEVLGAPARTPLQRVQLQE